MSLFELKTKVSGRYKIEKIKSNGEKILISDWFDNLITNGGLDMMANTSQAARLLYCQVGSGSTTPVVTDSALSNRVASTTTRVSTIAAVASVEPYYASHTITFSFAAGVATGNISEVGVGKTSTGDLFSRALILDDLGNPTSITVLPDEVLYVTYQIRYYPPLTDSTGVLNISGTDYTWVGRARKVTSASQWTAGGIESDVSSSSNTVSNGTIGAITDNITGTSAATSTISTSTYVDGSYYYDYTITCALTAGNVSGGISAIGMDLGNASYQMSFSPSIPKDSTKTLSLVFRHSWGRS